MNVWKSDVVEARPGDFGCDWSAAKTLWISVEGVRARKEVGGHVAGFMGNDYVWDILCIRDLARVFVEMKAYCAGLVVVRWGIVRTPEKVVWRELRAWEGCEEEPILPAVALKSRTWDGLLIYAVNEFARLY